MTSSATRFLRTAALALAAAGLMSSLVQAQQVYRIVGPDGKVTYSDQPPPAAANTRTTAGTGSAAGATSSGSLPYELRQVVSKYPVTLYSGDNCGPCASARALLITRGVPFTEKTVTSNADADALQRISGDGTLPFATIGGQQLKGFSDTEYTQFLSAAGYPGVSVLPANYRRSPATPLVAAVAPVAAPASAEAPAARTAAPIPVAPPPAGANNPAGIKF